MLERPVGAVRQRGEAPVRDGRQIMGQATPNVQSISVSVRLVDPDAFVCGAGR